MLGGAAGDDKEARVLNRIVKRLSSGIAYWADPRHYGKLVQELVLKAQNGIRVELQLDTK